MENRKEEIIAKIAEIYRQNIIDANAVATGKLRDFTYEWEDGDGYLDVYFNMPAYWKYSPENERTGHKFPPVSAIEDWIVNKGLPVESNKLPNVAFLIARKIAMDGWNGQPKKLLENSLDESEELITELCNILIDEEIDKLYEEVGIFD